MQHMVICGAADRRKCCDDGPKRAKRHSHLEAMDAIIPSGNKILFLPTFADFCGSDYPA